MTMPFVAFTLRMQAAAHRQLALIRAIQTGQSGDPAYLRGLEQRLGADRPIFALQQSDG